MTDKELDKIYDWIDHHITRYIGWNEWGSLRIINDERFKADLKQAVGNEEFVDDCGPCPEIKDVQELLRNSKHLKDKTLIITKDNAAIL